MNTCCEYEVVASYFSTTWTSHIRVVQSSHFEAFRGTVSMAILLYFGMLDSKPFRHIGETAKAANRGMSAESILSFE